ncbi:hypothetical protein [Desulfurispora thermophila]|uniref:hypothetical protein n=1 Tax=Desulfurispora thermophila TaxID=265470 RepID=UPI0003692C24|nr:hypothetical protein [Desulfurispora thermophila]
MQRLLAMAVLFVLIYAFINGFSAMLLPSWLHIVLAFFWLGLSIFLLGGYWICRLLRRSSVWLDLAGALSLGLLVIMFIEQSLAVELRPILKQLPVALDFKLVYLGLAALAIVIEFTAYRRPVYQLTRQKFRFWRDTGMVLVFLWELFLFLLARRGKIRD